MARSQMTASTLQALALQPLPPVSRVFVALAQIALTWEVRRTGRQSLRKLDAHLLKDIGISAQAARFEADKRFWQR
ncbi:MAG: DUF1127 domain-containing protein [Paracoccaceae bacterium]